MKTNILTPELLQKIDWSAVNYLSVGQTYLYDNPLLAFADVNWSNLT